MNDMQIKEEFARWIDAGRPQIWVKRLTQGMWVKVVEPYWTPDRHYIVDNKHAELRKLQCDEPKTKFQYYEPTAKLWMRADAPSWDIDIKYRVKPKKWYECIPNDGIICKVSNKIGLQHENNVAIIIAFNLNEYGQLRYFDNKFKSWLFAKPVKCDDLFKEKLNES